MAARVARSPEHDYRRSSTGATSETHESIDFRRSSTAGTLGERWRVRLGLLKQDGFTKPPPVPSS